MTEDPILSESFSVAEIKVTVFVLNILMLWNNRIIHPPNNLKHAGEMSFSSLAVKLWNDLPQHLRNSISISQFLLSRTCALYPWGKRRFSKFFVIIIISKNKMNYLFKLLMFRPFMVFLETNFIQYLESRNDNAK